MSSSAPSSDVAALSSAEKSPPTAPPAYGMGAACSAPLPASQGVLLLLPPPKTDEPAVSAGTRHASSIASSTRHHATTSASCTLTPRHCRSYCSCLRRCRATMCWALGRRAPGFECFSCSAARWCGSFASAAAAAATAARIATQRNARDASPRRRPRTQRSAVSDTPAAPPTTSPKPPPASPPKGVPSPSTAHGDAPGSSVRSIASSASSVTLP